MAPVVNKSSGCTCCPQWVSLGGSVDNVIWVVTGAVAEPRKAVLNHEPKPDTSESVWISRTNGVVNVATSLWVTVSTLKWSNLADEPMTSAGSICCHKHE